MALQVNDNNKFVLPIDVTAAGKVSKELQTAGTYVDKNIAIEVNVPDGALEVKQAGAVTATASINDNVYTSDTETKYPITINADATVGLVQVGVKTEGFVDSTDTVNVESSNAKTNSKTVYIKAGSLSGTGTASAEGGNGIVLGTKSTTAPESGFYVKASAAGGASVATPGWVDADTPSVSVNGDSYYPIASAGLSNAATEGKTYTTQQGPVLISGDYLYINKGYIDDTKISLADLVPDNATVSSESNNLIYKTISAYDKDGNLVTGTMDDATLGDITAQGTATISTVAITANEDNSAFVVSGTGAISGDTAVSVANVGYAKADLTKSGTISGSANVNAALNKITVSASADATDLTITPVITKDSSSATATGAITTTAPTSGHYVAVSADAIAKSATVSPSVASAGYGTTDVFNANNLTITAGSNPSGLYYVPLNDGGHSIAKEASAITAATAVVSSAITANTDATIALLDAAPAGDYITISASATGTDGSVTTNAKCVSTEGYVVASTQTLPITETVNVGITNAANKYIKIYAGELVESTN